MNRRLFFKRITITAAAIAFVPTVIVELCKPSKRILTWTRNGNTYWVDYEEHLAMQEFTRQQSKRSLGY